jgi:hypothetical protein
MGGGFSGIPLYLLQDRINYFSSSGNSNSLFTIIVLGGIAGVIIAALVIGFIKNGVSSARVGSIGGGSAVAPRRFNGFTLRRLAASYGLNREQTKTLEFVFRNDGVTDPERVLANAALLDRHFKRAYRAIKQNAPNNNEAQARFVRLFSLRNAIEAAPGGGTPGKIEDNMAAMLFTGRDSFPVKVISARKNGEVLAEQPRNALGTPVRIPPGSRVTLSFFIKAGMGFTYDSRVIKAQDGPRGPGLLLSLIGAAKPLAQRKFKRSPAAINCAFAFVFEGETDAQKRRPKLVVDPRRFTGRILDISVGGCSLRTAAAIRAGSLLKLEADNPGILCLGQVVRINRNGAAGSLMHIKFLKVPRGTFNTINALVFGYDG